jgi:hypothetical protein
MNKCYLPSPQLVCILEAKLCRVSILMIVLKYLQLLESPPISSSISTSEVKVK